jgi:hypothetical protein
MQEWLITQYIHTEEKTLKNKLKDFVNSAGRKHGIVYNYTVLPLSPYFYELNSIQLRQAQVSLHCHEQWNI